LDKAPDAFRTISEVAADLEIPQHVLRFWETRFSQIKPMKRSGGRRYYRPDDVDLLRGIRRLLYGEGYTIRGVQRILKEHGVKSVQGLVEGSSTPSFGAIEDEIGRSLAEDDHDTLSFGLDDEDDDDEISVVRATARREPADDDDDDNDDDEIPVVRVPARREPEIASSAPSFDNAPIPGVESEARRFDVARLEDVLADLIACRQLLDSALKGS
jgi:DNA-binding transcriptional MerR regulator